MSDWGRDLPRLNEIQPRRPNPTVDEWGVPLPSLRVVAIAASFLLGVVLLAIAITGYASPALLVLASVNLIATALGRATDR